MPAWRNYTAQTTTEPEDHLSITTPGPIPGPSIRGRSRMIAISATGASISLLTALLLAGCVSQSPYDQLQSQYQQLQTENEQLKS
jgi:hypothetical protein